MRFSVSAMLLASAMLVQPAHGALVKLRVDGKVTGSSFGPEAANDIFAVAPIGSSMQFSFQYDTDLTPTFTMPGFGSFPASANYSGVQIDGKFTVGGSTFSLPVAYLNSGGGPFLGSRFSVHENAPFSQTRIAGYQLVDFSLSMFDPTGTVLSGQLPTSFDLAAFPIRYFDARFAFGANGETRLTFAIDKISNAAVPEPATWALMLCGFGVAGAAVRRRTRLDTAVA